MIGAWWVSPLRRGPHVSHSRAQQLAGDDDLVIYWKLGCRHCMRLFSGLDRSQRRRATWVNVWKDEEAAQVVAGHNDGDVLTPTVVTGSGRRLPGSPDAVKAHLDEMQAA